MGRVICFGATGYTGRLTAHSLASAGLPLVLAGALVSRYGLVPVLWGLAALALLAALIEQPWRRC